MATKSKAAESAPQVLFPQDPAAPDSSQIARWKNEYGSLFAIEVEDFVLVMREPKVVDMERALASDPKNKKQFNFHRSIIANCKLYATPGLENDDQAMLGVFAEMDELVKTKEATVKKL